MSESRLPTALWIEAQLQPLAGRGVFHYIINKGERNSGVVMLKLNGLEGQCRLLIQQRDFESNEMGWAAAMAQETVEEADADAYIRRAVLRDPDLWVIEIEGRSMHNPFEGKTIE